MFYFSRMFLYPLAERIAPGLSQAGISPNAVTVLNLLLVASAAVIAVMRKNWMLASVLILARDFFDCLDGTMARWIADNMPKVDAARNKRLGAALDHYSDGIWAVGFFSALASVVWPTNPRLVLILGAVCIGVMALGVSCVDMGISRGASKNWRCTGPWLAVEDNATLLNWGLVGIASCATVTASRRKR